MKLDTSADIVAESTPSWDSSSPYLFNQTKKKRDCTHSSFACSKSRLGDTSSARAVTLTKYEATTTRGPACPFTRTAASPDSHTTNSGDSLCPSKQGGSTVITWGTGRRSLVAPANRHNSPSIRVSCCFAEVAKSPDNHTQTLACYQTPLATSLRSRKWSAHR